MNNDELNKQNESYYDHFSRFIKRIQNHVGVGPYKPISEEHMQQYINELKSGLDDWYKQWEQIVKESKHDC